MSPADRPDRATAARPIRSFVLRQGRQSEAQTRALTDLAPRFVLPFSGEPFDPVATFGRDAPLVVEIGFGMGETTATIAAAHPGIDYLGIEVHMPGVGALLKRIGELALKNVRIVRHDAVEVVRDMLRPGTVAAFHVFFPDPWPKKRHHKRRLLQGAFVGQLASRLRPGGYLHVATDWQDYAEAILATLEAEPLLANSAAGFAQRPDSRPVTKFEHRGQRLGHGVWDIVFLRKAGEDIPRARPTNEVHAQD